MLKTLTKVKEPVILTIYAISKRNIIKQAISITPHILEHAPLNVKFGTKESDGIYQYLTVTNKDSTGIYFTLTTRTVQNNGTFKEMTSYAKYEYV